ncbi:MAG: hypothetical protein A2W91_19675 [Bacteroidetes bacterium GWF2_38_335]|nr:MAG: hypothetical protein A2W91_19675 [Bacteroidetes bacterium GWF2_38_335]OFY79976.1 MAG: hypothetical protein A2281_11075 [Bacteroidetes bacterium RIFOXYA12_FULL_38_20]HBS86436.1 hypothetical protein [Bacteroidales bacterium]
MRENIVKHTLTLFGLLSVLFFSCTETPKKEVKETLDKSIVNIDSNKVNELKNKHELDQFRIEKLKEYGDSINTYFQTFGWGTDDYKFKCKIDTVINEKNICYEYKIGIPFNIYEFETNEGATDYFNELMTIELVSGFGINKRPNHILVDSNKVFWLKMEHPFGHRMKDIKSIFRKVFEFYPASTNLDSISGFNYCRRCNSTDTTLNEIYGKWYANGFIEIDTIEYVKQASYNGVIKSKIDTMMLFITKDSIALNNDKYFYNIPWARELPDAKYYWKYRFISPEFGIEKNRLTLEFRKKVKQLQNYRKGIIDYSVRVTKNGERYTYFIIAKTNNNEIYVTLDNRFYVLHKRK